VTENPEQVHLPTRTWGEPVPPHIPPDARDRARALFGDIIEGRRENVHRELGAAFADNLPADWFDRTLAKPEGAAGRLERMVALPARQSGDYTMVDVLLIFTAGDAFGEVVFDHAGKVAGLALQYPYPRLRWPEPGERQAWGGINRIPGVAELMRTGQWLGTADPAL
jgi:hypothetical protein